MKIAISNRQAAARLRPEPLRRLVRFCLERARRVNPRRRWAEVELLLADDAGMARLNRRHLGRPGTTDVISFAWPAAPAAPDLFACALCVNVERALAAPRLAPARELALYIAHACDHAAGASDCRAAGRRRMRARELAWLRAARRRGLLPVLPPARGALDSAAPPLA